LLFFAFPLSATCGSRPAAQGQRRIGLLALFRFSTVRDPWHTACGAETAPQAATFKI